MSLTEDRTGRGELESAGHPAGILVRSHRRSFTVAMVMAAVALAANVAIPAVVGAGIDEIRGDGGSVSSWVIALLVLALLRSVFTYGYRNRLYTASR